MNFNCCIGYVRIDRLSLELTVSQSVRELGGWRCQTVQQSWIKEKSSFISCPVLGKEACKEIILDE